MKAEDYFSVAMKLVNRVNELEIGKLLRQRAGGEVTLPELAMAAGQEAGIGANIGYSFICNKVRGRHHLAEVWIGLTERGPWLFPKPAALQRQRSPVGRLCPDGRGIIIDGQPEAPKSD
jgi:ribonuclease I